VSVTTALTVPASIEEIVQRFDGKEEAFNEHNIAIELRTASAAIVEPSEAEAAEGTITDVLNSFTAVICYCDKTRT
jgi:hypothetical protein